MPSAAGDISREKLRFALETYSYRFGELILNARPRIKEEIASILLHPGVDIETLSRDGYVEVLHAAFVQQGWEHQPSIYGSNGNLITLMDFRKEGVGIRLGFQPNAPQVELMKFQVAKRHPAAAVDLGIYITATAPCQKELAHLTGKLWAGPTFQTVVQSLPPLARVLEIPMCIMGLYIYEAPTEVINPLEMPPGAVKQRILEFLEARYGRRIDKNVHFVNAGLDVYLDGVLSLEDRDVILAVELSRSSGNFPSRLLSDSILRFVEIVRQYRNLTKRNVCLRFVLMGAFSKAFIEDVFGEAGIAYGWAEDIEVEYEVHSFAEFEAYLLEREKRG